MRAVIVTPHSIGGNRVTALRWAKRLRELGMQVRVVAEWTDEPCDVLIALHAHKSHASVARHARAHPDGRRVVALTGTDVYGELDRDELVIATRIVVLQPRALDRVPAELRPRTRVIVQSAVAAAPMLSSGFTACVLAHFRDVKDPLLAARAVKLVPADSKLRVVHLGGAHDASWIDRARDAERETHGRWTWLGAKRRQDALGILAGAQLLLVTSRSEGGANVVSEAIAAGVPVISTRIDGSLGILGDDYPGYCDVGDAEGLARALARSERDPGFVLELRRRVIELQPSVAPARERASWREMLDDMGIAHDGH
jgi:putative glycosyltransferase (TIGR04348 family)